jgi:hypothetical protein
MDIPEEHAPLVSDALTSLYFRAPARRPEIEALVKAQPALWIEGEWDDPED